MKSSALFKLLACLLIMPSCLKDKTLSPDPGACGTVISYSTEIVPIINTSCVTNQGPGTGCHDAWIFEYDNITSYIDLGIWQNEVLIELTMPEIPNIFGIDSLTPDQRHTMQCWIEQGYPEN